MMLTLTTYYFEHSKDQEVILPAELPSMPIDGIVPAMVHDDRSEQPRPHRSGLVVREEHQISQAMSKQPDLFDQMNLPPFTLPTIKQAEAERDLAILRTTVSNGPEFGRLAKEHILERLKEGPVSGEELVLSCKNSGIIPEKDDRAFGGIFMSLSKKGLIVKAGSVQRRRGHNTGGGIVWALNPQKP